MVLGRRGMNSSWLVAAVVVLLGLVVAISAAHTDDINVRKLQQFTAPPSTTSTSSNGTTTAAAADEDEEEDATETETSTLSPTATETNTTTATNGEEEDADADAEDADAEDADASAAVDADANAYNQGSEDCIYGDHPTSLVDTAAATPEFSTLVAALNASGLVGALSDPSTKLTVFAPTNEAFDKLFSDFNVTAEEVLGNTKFLSDVLKYHVVGDVTAFGDLTDGSSLPTLLEGESLGVSTSESTATIYGAFGFPLGTQTAEAVTIIGGATNATVVRGNVWTCNAVVQVIDSVLVPQSAVSASE
jgi:uncharacterized surface protein with fasciclin (FAS1) repeats